MRKRATKMEVPKWPSQVNGSVFVSVPWASLAALSPEQREAFLKGMSDLVGAARRADQ